MPLTNKEVYDRIHQRYPDAVVKVEEVAGDPFAVIHRDRIIEVCTFLRDDPELQFNYLSCLSGVDDGTTLWVVYHLYSIPCNQNAVIKVDVGRDDPHVASVTGVWTAADWHEREAYDLVGMRFEGHPDLRRILLPEDWPGHPLRKDYEYPEEYQGIPLT
jgi:NADH-quinone oxidoreductase subunit C